MPDSRVNWHLATISALKIDLEEYQSILEYESEIPIGRSHYRIDLLIIYKNLDFQIPKALAADFKKINLFEIKGIGSSTSIQSYYKIAYGYVGLFIDNEFSQNHYTSENITINFISRRFPRKLVRHLSTVCGRTIEKIAPRIYNVNNNSFITRLIITKELSPDDYIFLRCLTNEFSSDDYNLFEKIVEHSSGHQNDQIYADYFNQLAISAFRKEEPLMDNKLTFLDLFNKSIDKLHQVEAERDSAVAKLDSAEAERDSAVAKLDSAEAEIIRLTKLLEENGIKATS